MALFQKKSATAVASLETELNALRRKRDDLVGRRERLTFQLAEAEQARKHALLLDDGEDAPAALSKAAAHFEACRSSLDGVAILLAEMDAKIVALEDEIALGKSRAQREAQAKAFEAKRAAAELTHDALLAAAANHVAALAALEGDFYSMEIGTATARFAGEVANARESWRGGLDYCLAELRRDPPRRPVQPEPTLSERGSGSFHSGFEPASAYGADRRAREPIWS